MPPTIRVVGIGGGQANDVAFGETAQAKNGSVGVSEIGRDLVDFEDFAVGPSGGSERLNVHLDLVAGSVVQLFGTSDRLCWAALVLRQRLFQAIHHPLCNCVHSWIAVSGFRKDEVHTRFQFDGFGVKTNQSLAVEFQLNCHSI